MKRSIAILKIVILTLIGIGLTTLAWMFVVPGMVLWWIFRERYPRSGWIGNVTALLIVLILRFSVGEWQVKISGQSGEWWVELTSGLISWAIGSILVSAGYHIPRCFLNGLRMKDQSGERVTG